MKNAAIVCLLLSSAGALCAGAAQEGPRVRSAAVAISGENPFINLSLAEGGTVTTSVSFWRVVHSPAGRGHACYVSSDVTGNGPTPDDLRVVYTDNRDLVEYLNREIMSAFDRSYAERPYRQAAATFQSEGDTRTEYREVVTSAEGAIRLVWRDFLPALLIDVPVKPFTIITTIVPARVAEVHVNGVKAAGRVFARPEGTAQGSSGSLAFSETWIK